MSNTRSKTGLADDRVGIICRTALDVLYTVDDARRFVRVSEQLTKLLGAPAKVLRRGRLEDFTPEEHLPLLDARWAEFERHGTHQGLFEIQVADGSRKIIEYRATRDFDAGEHLVAARELGVWSRVEDPGPWGSDARTRLSPREREVLQLVATGYSAPEIAHLLALSPGTVKTHLKHVYEKLGARDRGSAVAAGLRMGLIE